MVDLAIVIVSYKTPELTDACLRSIRRGEYPFSMSVVVVDNAPGDGTAEMIAEKHPWATVTQPGRNTGFSGGNNVGIKTTDSKYVLLLNPDTEVEPGTLSAMVEFMNRNPRAGICGCRLLNPDGSPQDSWLDFPLPLSKALAALGLKEVAKRAALGYGRSTDAINEKGAIMVDVVKGACLMIRRETIDDIGLMDENSFLYADDVEWCLRAKKRGWNAYALTGATIMHHGHASTDKEPYITITSSRRSAVYLYKKHYPAPVVFAWRLLLLCEVAYKYGLNKKRLARNPADSKRAEMARAYRDLLGELKGGAKKQPPDRT